MPIYVRLLQLLIQNKNNTNCKRAEIVGGNIYYTLGGFRDRLLLDAFQKDYNGTRNYL